jgi:hypothetical protein
MPGFACGVLLQTQLAAQYNSTGTVTYRSLYQLIPAIGTGIRLLRGMIRFGYSLQWVNEAIGNVTTSSLTSLAYNKGISQGSGISHNLGVGLTLPIKFLPSFDLVVRNATATSFISPVIYSFAPSSTSVPSTEPMTFDGSFSLQPHLGRGSMLNLVAEYRDILNKSNDALWGRLAFGGELSLRGRFFLRGGYSGGYPAAGFGMKNGKTELSFAWFTAEIGSSYKNDGDTRIMMQYQLRSF